MAKRGIGAGFTLIEMMVVLAVMSILLSLAVPAMSGVVMSIRLTAATNSFLSNLWLARSEAIKRNARAVICKSATGQICTTAGSWEQGWIVFSDANNNASRDAGEVIISREEALHAALRFSGNNPVANYVSYTPSGQTKYTSGAFQAGTLTLCSLSSTTVEARQIAINSAGRPRTAKTTVGQCP